MNQKWNKKWALSAAVILASGLSVAPTVIHAATQVSGDTANTNGASATDGTSGKSTAVGDNANAINGGTAVGSGASAALGVAVGSGAIVHSQNGVAVGAGASSMLGIAIGYNAKTVDDHHDIHHSAIAIGCEATSKAGIAIGHGAVADVGLAIGYGSKTENSALMAIGFGNSALSGSAIAIGGDVDTDSTSSIAIGKRSKVGKSSMYSIALLGEVNDNSHDSIAIGDSANVYKNQSIAIGLCAYNYAEKSVTIGTYSGAKEGADNAVAIGRRSIADEENTVAVGNAKQTFTGWDFEENRRRITYVADGIKNTDAATYGQLVNAQAVTTTSGEGESQTTNTTYTPYTADSDGIVTVLTNNGGTAFKIKVGTSGGGGTSYTGDNKTISISDKNVISVKTDGAVAKDNAGIVTGGTVYDSMITDGRYDSTSGKLHFTNGKGEDAFSIAIEGSGVIYKGDGKTIALSDSNEFSVKYDATDLTVNDSGLAVKKDGKVESGNTGLVTGGTVYDALKDMNNRTDELTNDINKVGAGAAALAALRPETFDPNDKWSFAVGYGHYKNANAGALGAFFKPNADTTVSFSSTVGNGDPMMNAGVSFKLGSRGKNAGAYRNAVELVARVDALEATDARHESLIAAQANQIASQQKEIASQQKEIASQQKEIAAQAQEIHELKAQVAALMQHAGLSATVAKTAAL